jgi:hypothetical protein
MLATAIPVIPVIPAMPPRRPAGLAAAAADWLRGPAAWLPMVFCLPVSIYLWTRPSRLATLPCKS